MRRIEQELHPAMIAELPAVRGRTAVRARRDRSPRASRRWSAGFHDARSPALREPQSIELVLCTAVSAFLGRYRGQTRVHTESDLRVFLRWYTDQELNPLAPTSNGMCTAARCPTLPAVHSLPPTVGRGRLLSRPGDRPDPAALASRLRPPATGSPGVTDARSWSPAVRSAARPARAADLRSVRLEHHRPPGGTWPPGPARTRQRRQTRPRPIAPAVARAIDRAADGRTAGPILRNTLGGRMDRHAATRRLKHLAATARIRPRSREPRPPPQLHPGRVHGPPEPDHHSRLRRDERGPTARLQADRIRQSEVPQDRTFIPANRRRGGGSACGGDLAPPNRVSRTGEIGRY